MNGRFCREEVLCRFDGDAALLKKVAIEFLARSATLEARLRTELIRGEMAEAGLTAHALKGLIAYFDRGIVFEFARHLQCRADAADFVGAEALLVPLSALVEELRDDLRKEVGDVR